MPTLRNEIEYLNHVLGNFLLRKYSLDGLFQVLFLFNSKYQLKLC